MKNKVNIYERVHGAIVIFVFVFMCVLIYITDTRRELHVLTLSNECSSHNMSYRVAYGMVECIPNSFTSNKKSMITKTSSSLRWNNGVLQYMTDVIIDGISVGREWVDVPTVEEEVIY